MITKIKPNSAYRLHTAEQTRKIEDKFKKYLSDNELMQRAGLSCAALARAIAPHANKIWIVCGYGNNGVDGLIAAHHLSQLENVKITVTWLPNKKLSPIDLTKLPYDTQTAWKLIKENEKIYFSNELPDDYIYETFTKEDLIIDALIGLGNSTPTEEIIKYLDYINSAKAKILHVDLPSGLNSDTGKYYKTPKTRSYECGETHTLSLLTLKSGLFINNGVDTAGQIWFDDLDVNYYHHKNLKYIAEIYHPNNEKSHNKKSLKNTSKGDFGDVIVIGGQIYKNTSKYTNMAGAAILATNAALYGGAGRVYLYHTGDYKNPIINTNTPEVMQLKSYKDKIKTAITVCGCGGGASIKKHLAYILKNAPHLVLDADALNHISEKKKFKMLLSQRAKKSFITILTPHPLEAARLLKSSVHDIQSNRILSTKKLANKYNCIALLKGAGTIITAPKKLSKMLPQFIIAGNERLSTAGTGDVLAGLIAAKIANKISSKNLRGKDNHYLDDYINTVCAATWQHGIIANNFNNDEKLTASKIIKMLK